MIPAGHRLFARYAYAPNARGYCGPREGAVLEAVACGAGGDVDVPAVARRFSGAWPYQALLAELAGIDDPLDEQVGRAYWTGSALTDRIDTREFGTLLLERFAAQAGHYWQHLTPDLLDEVTPTHVFHVLGVYPWTRLLAPGRPEPLEVLDGCRVRPAEVVAVELGGVRVRAQTLAFEGGRLVLTAPAEETVSTAAAHGSFTGPLSPGDAVAVHWGHACDVLSTDEVAHLERLTGRQLKLTNARLARAT